MIAELRNREQAGGRRKRALRWIAGLFIGMLLLFTFFSNTMRSLTLPKVAAQAVSKGQLARTFDGKAALEPVEQRELTGPAGWLVAKVHVQEGGEVKKGEALIEYDGDELERQIAADKAALAKLDLSIEKLEYDLKRAWQGGDEGALLSAKTAYESARMDRHLLEQQIRSEQTKLKTDSVLTAPFDGRVLAVHAEAGMASGSLPDVVLSRREKGYRFALPIPAELAETLAVGEELEVRLADPSRRTLAGKVEKLEPKQAAEGPSISGGVTDVGRDVDVTELTIAVHEPDLRGGDRVNLHLSVPGQDDTLLIALTSLRKNNTGTYVYVVENRLGPLGNAYFATRRDVEVADSNETTAAIRSGLFEGELVVTDSSEPLSSGARVRMD